MKKIQKTSELLWLLGTMFVAIGVTICSKANLGVSMIAAPAFVIQEALVNILPWVSVGMTEYVIQGILLILLCLVIRKFNWRFIFAFLVAFIYGYVLDFFLWVFSSVNFNEIWLRWVMLIVGDCLTAFGVACFFRTSWPLQVYELFVAKLFSTYKLSINKVKWFFDISLLIISIVLACTLFGDVKTFDWTTIYYNSFHFIGLGTLVTTIINSPIITAMGKVIDKIFTPSPLLPKVHAWLNK